jgi:hypothetical protein
MTSRASATALNGAPATPSIALPFLERATLMAISVAPPPGASDGLNTTFLATDMASAKLRSISLRISFEGPRRRMVHALGDLHSVRKVKYLLGFRQLARIVGLCAYTYSSPNFSMWNKPQSVPTSDSLRSSTLLTIVAPTALAILLLSDFLTLRMAVIGGSALSR